MTDPICLCGHSGEDHQDYAVIINQDGNWEIYRSRHIPHTDATHIAATLIHIAEHLTRETP